MDPCFFPFLPRGTLTILKDSRCGVEDVPVNFGKSATNTFHAVILFRG